MSDDPIPTMTPYELAGAIRQCREIYMFCQYNESAGVWVSVSKPQAHLVVEDAKKDGVEEIEAFVDEDGELCIGCDLTDIFEDEEPEVGEEPSEETPE